MLYYLAFFRIYKKKWIIKDEYRNLTLQLQQPAND